MKMEPSFELLTERLRMRPLCLADAGAMAALVTPGISRWTANFPDQLSSAQAAEIIAPIVGAMTDGDDVTLAIEPLRGRRFIGWIGLRRLKDAPRRANLGFWMGESFQGRGWAREAAQAFLPAAWRWLDVDVIEAGARPDNAPSLAVLRGLGMAPAGERMNFAKARGREELCLYFEALRPVRAGAKLA